MIDPLLGLFTVGAVLTLIVGFYALVTTRNLIRTLIALEVLTKGVTLLIIVTGHAAGRMALAQSLAITLIVIEVAVIVAAVGIVLCVHRTRDTVDTEAVSEIKG
jgi:NADH:ubiquinone oxidoreductase subunit K